MTSEGDRINTERLQSLEEHFRDVLGVARHFAFVQRNDFVAIWIDEVVEVTL